MSQIKLLHSGGNGVSIVAPDNNPASDRTLKLPSDGDGTILTTNSSVGKILQVKQTVKTDVVSRGGSSGTDALAAISGLSVDITPSATTSKIYIITNLKLSSTNCWARFQLRRGSTAIYTGNKNLKINKENKNQIDEIGNIKWCNYSETINKIRERHYERKNIITEIISFITNKLTDSTDLINKTNNIKIS